jgi:hypothetical protein
MHTVAGNFNSIAEARSALGDINRQGVPPDLTTVIQGNDSKGFEREHRTTRDAARRGAVTGAILGIAISAFLIWIADAHLSVLRLSTLFLCGTAVLTAGGATIFALWNMGTSHDEALLFEEARDTGAVIATVEASEPMEEAVIHSLETHGGHNVRAGDYQPQGWTHSHPRHHSAV